MPTRHRGRGRHLVRHDQPPHARCGGRGDRRSAAGRARLYRWDAGGDNPYHALLGLADRFVVTGDSISMMVEVARLGKPLAIFALPASGWLRLRSASASAWRRSGMPPGPLASLADALYRLRIAKYGRDLSEIHRRLYARGLAVPLGQPFRPPQTRVGRPDPSGRARPGADVPARRLTSLFSAGSSSLRFSRKATCG